MSLLDRIRARQEADKELEQRHRISRSGRPAVSRADVEAIEDEMVPWMARKRRERRDAIRRGEIPPD